MPIVHQILEETRRELLDLSTRNRLLSMPIEAKSARVVHVRDEKCEHVFRLLVGEKRTFAFTPSTDKRAPASAKLDVTEGNHDLEIENENQQEPEKSLDSSAPGRRHLDTKLQTSLSPDGLQRRLLSIYRDSKSMIEEQGVNILYLALGRLKWFEANKADTPRYAPLILVPVEIKRKGADERFTLHWREEDVQENLSLSAKLRAEFGIEMPKFPSEEELIPSIYAEAVSRAVGGQERWEVQPDAILLGGGLKKSNMFSIILLAR